MRVDCATLELRIRPPSPTAPGYPVEMTLYPPDDEARPLPTGYISQEILHWRSREDSVGDGARLFDLLVEDPRLKQNWTQSRAASGQRIRVRLRFDADEALAPLHAIPWELLADTTVDPPQLLAAHRNTPFSRYVTSASSGKTIEERPIKVLVAVASPEKLKLDGEPMAVDVALEEQIVVDALTDLLSNGQVEITFLEQPVTLSRLEDALKNEAYHVLHIVGHGRYVESRSRNVNAAYLYLADENHRARPVRDADFAAMIGRGERAPKFVFLASCQTAKRQPDDPFQGFAPALHRAGVPAVLAMQEKVHIPTSQAFTGTFYRELFEHGQIDVACNAARAKVLTEALRGSHVPVLFSRLHNNQLLVPPVRSAERQEFEPALVYVRSGPFVMGRAPGEGVPPAEVGEQEVVLPPYLIGKYPVTNREYHLYLQKTGRIVNSRAGWNGNVPPPDKLDHPVAGVTWDEASAYCAWLREETGREYALPSEAQWEKAARGADGRLYPWGDVWQEGRCNHGGEGTTPVCAFPEGVSPYGCYDVVGHVRQWVNTRWGRTRDAPDEAYSYPWAPDERENSDPDRYTLRVYRGGAALDPRDQVTCTARGGFRPDRPGPPHKRHGFRVVVNLERH